MDRPQSDVLAMLRWGLILIGDVEGRLCVREEGLALGEGVEVE